MRGTLAILLTVALLLGGCGGQGCTKAQETAVLSTIDPLAACIVQAASSDFAMALADPLSLVGAIGAACVTHGVVTAEAIVTVIESWFEAAPTPPTPIDASIDAGDAGGNPSPPMKVVASRLRRVRDLVQPLTLRLDASTVP